MHHSATKITEKVAMGSQTAGRQTGRGFVWTFWAIAFEIRGPCTCRRDSFEDFSTEE